MSTMSRLLIRSSCWRCLGPLATVRLGFGKPSSSDSTSLLIDKAFDSILNLEDPRVVEQYLLQHVRSQALMESFCQKLVDQRTRFSPSFLSKAVFILGSRLSSKSGSAVSKSFKDLLADIDKGWTPAELSKIASGVARVGIGAFAHRPDLLITHFVDSQGIDCLEPSDLCHFAEALVYHKLNGSLKESDAESLFERVGQRLAATISDFSTENLLLLSNQLVKGGVPARTAVIQKAEELASTQLANLSDDAISWIARRLLPLNCLRVGADSFKRELIQRVSTLGDRHFANIFAVLGENEQLDGSMLDQLCKFFPHTDETFSVAAVLSCVDVLSQQHLRKMPEARSLSNLLSQVIFKTIKNYSSSECCQALHYLSRLGSIQRPLFTHLLRTALAGFDDVSLPDIAFLVDAAACFDEEKFTRKILRALPTAQISGASMTLKSCRLVSDGLVKLRAPQASILKLVVDYLLTYDIKELLVSETHSAKVILTNLAMLSVSARVLYEEVATALDNLSELWHDRSMLTDLCWSCVSHGVFPVLALQAVFYVSPKVLRHWPKDCVLRLQQVHVIVSTRPLCGVDKKLSQHAFSEMQSLLKRYRFLSAPEEARHCLNGVKKLVGKDYLLLNHITEEGLVVYGALIVNPQGAVTSWPSDRSVVNKLWLERYSLRPVAIMPFGKRFFAHPVSSGVAGTGSNRILGSLIVRVRALQQAGWTFLLIPLEDWKAASNRQEFLTSYLTKAGVKVAR